MGDSILDHKKLLHPQKKRTLISLFQHTPKNSQKKAHPTIIIRFRFSLGIYFILEQHVPIGTIFLYKGECTMGEAKGKTRVKCHMDGYILRYLWRLLGYNESSMRCLW
jgi:hypothetical protein